jgi:hypothetical protein
MTSAAAMIMPPATHAGSCTVTKPCSAIISSEQLRDRTHILGFVPIHHSHVAGFGGIRLGARR